jgi:succinate-semialdehyde dehydrogenase / glutarate-semialdehyde dehydrogenase
VETARSINPWTEKPIRDWSFETDSELDQRLHAAVAAQRTWSALTATERAQRLQLLAQKISQERDALAQWIVREMGKPISQSLAEVDKCALICRHYAAHAADYLADTVVKTEARDARIVLEPLGVVLSITPWNFPLWQILRFAVPTLLLGNTVIVKPAPNVIGCAQALAELVAASLGGPVLSVAIIDHASAARLIADSRIVAVALTGSERAGSAVAALTGQALKPCLLELGGSDPLLVLRGANVATVARAAAEARFANAGQVCIAAKRIIVEADIASEFIESFVAISREYQPDDPQKATTLMGPMARGDLRMALLEQQHTLQQQGGQVLLAGGAQNLPGYSFAPSVLKFDTDIALGNSEAFGPLAVVQTARDLTHAVRLANDTVYGLSASVWTEDLDRARQAAALIQAGSVFINQKSVSDPRLPIGGIKRSGFGRELGREGVKVFANLKTIVTA